jgi:hypothetical protein
MSHILDSRYISGKKVPNRFKLVFYGTSSAKNWSPPTTNPKRMLLFSLGGQFENTLLGLGSGWK